MPNVEDARSIVVNLEEDSMLPAKQLVDLFFKELIFEGAGAASRKYSETLNRLDDFQIP